MHKVLFINGHVKKEKDSATLKIAQHFLRKYKKRNPQDQITQLNLVEEDIHFLEEEDLDLVSGKDLKTKSPILDYSRQFAAADKYIIAAPMWNLTIPARLKAYLEYVSVPGITFEYVKGEARGLLKNKKAIHITARGGIYGTGERAEREMGDRYLRKLFQRFGILKIETLYIDGLNIERYDPEVLLQQAWEDATRRAINF